MAAFLALGAGELAEEVFVNAAEQIDGAMRRQRRCLDFAFSLAFADSRGEFRLREIFARGRTNQDNRPNEIDQLAQAALVERGARVIFRQDAFQALVVAFDRDHGVINNLPNG